MNSSPQVLVAHPGTQYSHRLVLELHKKNLLGRFHTGLAFTADGWSDRAWRALPDPIGRRLANRRICGLPPERLCCHPLLELSALWRINRGADAQMTFHRRNEQFQRAISNSALAAADAVIGFDTSSWVLSRRCAEVGVPLLLDQSIGHPDAKLEVYEHVRERFPKWSEDVETRRPEVREAEDLEHRRADIVVAASSFTQRTLIEHGVAENKIAINPYGVDAERFNVIERRRSHPLRFVFVGSIGARKGVPLLLAAWAALRAEGAELWLVGPASKAMASLIPDLPGLRYLGPVPHTELPSILRECDVMVFPSYFEGFGLVILEAMACGLPVLTTTATAGTDIITHGVDGWVIEPGDLEQLTEIMSECLAKNSAVEDMGRCARMAAQRFSWAGYGRRWAEIIQRGCGQYLEGLPEGRSSP